MYFFVSTFQCDPVIVVGFSRGSKKESEQDDQYFLNFEFILQIWHSQSD